MYNEGMCQSESTGLVGFRRRCAHEVGWGRPQDAFLLMLMEEAEGVFITLEEYC